MQSPSNLDNQQDWGGEDFRTGSSNNDQTIRTHGTHGELGSGVPSSQRGFIASNSDNLFHPAPVVPAYVFNLPDVPLNPHPYYNTYHQNHSNSFPRQIPPSSSYTSFNNPSFVIPPLPPHFPHNNTSFRTPAPPTSPFIQRQPAYNQFRAPASPFVQRQPAYTQFPPNHIPPNTQIHYYIPHPSSSSSLSPVSKALPTTTHIPLLTSKLDFYPWDEAVTTLLRANGLIGHILDLPDFNRPDRVPVPMPILSVNPSPDELAGFNRWWDADNIAQHVIASRLGPIPRALLPSTTVTTRTALSIYKMLVQYYGTCSYADCADLANSLYSSACVHGRVPDYVSKWRIGISRLQSAQFPFSIKMCLNQFVRGLPLVAAFTSLRATLPDRIATAGDNDFGAFIVLTETVLEQDTIFRAASQAQSTRPNQRSQISSSTVTPPAVISLSSAPAPVPADTHTQPPRASLFCTNCKVSGHLVPTCFKKGGGMEGRRAEYMANREQVRAFFSEMLDDAADNFDVGVDFLSPPDPPIDSGHLPPMLDDKLVQPMAAMSFNLDAPNSSVRLDLYSKRDFEVSRFAFSGSTDFTTSAFVSVLSIYNALLDSGCTHHIVRDRSLFSNYASKSISIGTANCGTLAALGTGDVDFKSVFGSQPVIFTLRGCLYAPSAPTNLLSVGALVERGMSTLFSPGGITKVSFPDDHPSLPGFALRASVVNRLSFLKLDFLPPPDPLDGVTALHAPSFPRVKIDSMLWHRRFGHIGMDATRAALTKSYVKGVAFEGPFLHDHCVPCIVGKSPRQSYSHHGHRASKIGELLHMDLCGPYPVQAPRGEKHFYNILDDKSNFGFTFGLRHKNDAFSHYTATESFIERATGSTIIAVRCGGELELTSGDMGRHFTSRGISVQKTVPYAHQQNGKSERYIRTLEEGGQALLADSGLPTSFWLDAVLTRQYLMNRLPTSTLPDDVTPFEVFTNGRKPDLSHLRVWGCECYVAIPDEIRPKAGFKRFKGIFVGYEEHRVGWRVRDLNGKYIFSNDVIFNESLSGRLGVPRPFPSATPDDSSLPSPHPIRSRVRTVAGRAFDDVIRLKEFRSAERDKRVVAAVVGVAGDVDKVSVDGGVDAVANSSSSLEVINDFVSFLAPSSFPDQPVSSSLVTLEDSVLRDHIEYALSTSSSSTWTFDISKIPSSFSEAISRPDASIWRAAMDRELKSLDEMGAFEVADLPAGDRAIGLKWVYDRKTDANGVNIAGKEKARLVAQGFNQRPGQYDETYAPVAKMASVRILLAWAAVHDLDIFQFDCKTAFLHAKLRHPVYGRQIPGFPLNDPKKVLRIRAALYGLRQSSFEFYTLFLSLLIDLGMVRCEVDHGIFVGTWLSPPDPSVSMLPDGRPLVLYVPLHVDDGLGITNSLSLYRWFLSTLAKRLHIVDMGPCSKFLSIVIIRDRPNRRLWLSSHVYVAELLEEWNLTSCRAVSTPFPTNLTSSMSPAPANALPDVSDVDLIPKYQRLVGCLLYLAIATRPDLSYYAMWLGQFNAKPTRAHFLAAKHVLRYLAGTRTFALCLGTPFSPVPSSLQGFMQSVGCSDADWASDSVDRKSISGYSFYFLGSLVSWSAVKQKSIALSSTEAEYYAMTHAFKEALWMRVFLGLLRFPVPRPFPILSDNQAACALSHSPAISARSKHIDIRHHFIRTLVQDGSFSTTWVPTEDMPADIFTKSLPFAVFSRHRDVLGLFIPPSLA
jgi:hypothetical protein